MPEHSLAAIRSLREMLAANGVQLLVMLVPGLHDISARVLLPEFRDIPAEQTADTVETLLRNGIEAVYADDDLLKNPFSHPFMFFYPENGHPADGCQDTLSEIAAERLRRRFGTSLRPTVTPDRFSTVFAATVYDSKYRFPENCDTGNHRVGEAINCRRILLDGKRIKFDASSSVLVTGNSYSQTPTAEGSFPAYLGKKLGIVPDYYLIGGFGPTITLVKSLADNPEKYLRGKKILVMVLGVEHLFGNAIDIRQLDEYRLMMNGMTLCSTLNVVDASTPKNQIESALATASPVLRDDWRKFTGDDVFVLLLSKRHEAAALTPIKLPEGIDSRKELLCLVTTATFNQRQIVVSVNGIKQPVPPSIARAAWQNIAVKLPPGTSDLRLTFSGNADNSMIALKNILVYQKK